jgi:hypothetical protein
MGFNPNYGRLVTVTTHVILRVEGVSRAHIWTQKQECPYRLSSGLEKRAPKRRMLSFSASLVANDVATDADGSSWYRRSEGCWRGAVPLCSSPCARPCGEQNPK